MRQQVRQDARPSYDVVASGKTVVVGLAVPELSLSRSLYDTDVYAKNTLEEPERVTMKPATSSKPDGGAVTTMLLPASWTAVSLA